MHARHRCWVTGLLVAGLMGLAAGDASGLINPNFTPVHLVRQSSLVAELEFQPVKGAKCEAAVKRVLKGKLDARTISFDFSTCAVKEHVELLVKGINAAPHTQAAFFVGEFQEKPGEGTVGGGGQTGPPPGEKQEGETERKAYLFVNGNWMTFYEGNGGAWGMDETTPLMLTTWQGGTDMLLRAVEYILSDADAYLPAKEGVNWAEPKRFTRLSGAVRAAIPVDLTGDGKWTLFVACEGGDRLFEYDAKTDSLKDTESHKLSSKSHAAAWGDTNGDGRLDLVSYDGQAITIYTQGEDRTFQVGPKLDKGQLAGGCLGLAVLDWGTPGRPGVLISTGESPVLWIPDPKDAKKGPQTRRIAFGEPPTALAEKLPSGEPLGPPGPCLVADLDGDVIPDVLQVFAKGSLIYRGKSPGEFAPPERCVIAAGSGHADAFLGDFDADGLLDVFTVSEDAGRLWQNDGKLRFTETRALSGEAAYKVEAGGLCGVTGDFNNDGRQDFVLFYAAGFPRSFFNRGFRSFGFTNALDIGTNSLLPAASDGQQAGTLCDFTGDGAQDLVLILKNGEGWILPRETGDLPALCARGALAVRGNCTGPLTVTGYKAGRCLGAWNVTAGTTEAFVGVLDAGPVTLKWRIPPGKPGTKDILIENHPVRYVINP